MRLEHQKLGINARKDFPIMQQQNGKPLIYLDSAATTQKPVQVLAALQKFYRTTNANVHRGIYSLSVEATELYETARKKIAKFINATNREIVFVRNATEAINLVAKSWGWQNVTRGDLIVVTEMEHHSNLVPWQQLAKEKQAKLGVIPVTAQGTLDLASAKILLEKKPKILAITHISNVLGTINPVEELIAMAHKVGAIVLLDACQSVPHMKVDVKELDADFMVFSGHKMLGPTGIGVLYGKLELLEEMPPFLHGGEMIKEVTWNKTTWNDVPHKFEAGTPPVAEAIALATAVDYLQSIGMHVIRAYEKELIAYALEQLKTVPGVTIYGPQNTERGSVISFNLGDVHAHDLASVLDDFGICVRSGHHCCMPLHEKLGIAASARISFSVYNTKEEIDALIAGLHKSREVFKL